MGNKWYNINLKNIGYLCYKKQGDIGETNTMKQQVNNPQ